MHHRHRTKWKGERCNCLHEALRQSYRAIYTVVLLRVFRTRNFGNSTVSRLKSNLNGLRRSSGYRNSIVNTSRVSRIFQLFCHARSCHPLLLFSEKTERKTKEIQLEMQAVDGEVESPNSQARRWGRVISPFSRWEALRRCEAINQFFHSRRRMPWRWRFLLRYVIRLVLEGETKKKCLRTRLRGMRKEVLHYSCHRCFFPAGFTFDRPISLSVLWRHPRRSFVDSLPPLFGRY